MFSLRFPPTLSLVFLPHYVAYHEEIYEFERHCWWFHCMFEQISYRSGVVTFKRPVEAGFPVA